MSNVPDRSIRFHLPLRIIFGAVFSLFSTFSLIAAPEPGATITVYAESNSLDSELVETDDGSMVEGYASDLVRAVLSQAGYRADIEVVPWSRLMYFLESEPNVLAYNMTRTPEREQRFHWLGEVRPVRFSLWGLRERSNELPQTLSEASDYRVGVFRNDVVEQYLLGRDFTELVYVSENYDLMGILQRRRIDFIPYSYIAMQDFKARDAQVRDSLVPIIDLEEISTAHYLVMSLNSDPVLVERLQTAYQTLVDNGVHAEILGSTLPR